MKLKLFIPSRVSWSKMAEILEGNSLKHTRAFLCLIAVFFQLTLPSIHVLHVVKSESLELVSNSITTAAIQKGQNQSHHDSSQCFICSIFFTFHKLTVLTSSNSLSSVRLLNCLILDSQTNPIWLFIGSISPRSPPFLS
jgi:hypothetical protein